MTSSVSHLKLRVKKVELKDKIRRSELKIKKEIRRRKEVKILKFCRNVMMRNSTDRIKDWGAIPELLGIQIVLRSSAGHPRVVR